GREHRQPNLAERPAHNANTRPHGQVGRRAPGDLRGDRAARRGRGRGGDAPPHPVRDGRPAGQHRRGPRRGRGSQMTTVTDTLVIGGGSAGLFAALRAAAHGSVIVLEAGPDGGDPPPHWALYDYALPDAYYPRYTHLPTG